MSATQEQTPPVLDAENLDAETRAKIMGWKPKDQYKGPAENWRDAQDWLDHTFETPRLLLASYRNLENKFAAVTRDTDGIKAELQDAKTVVTDMSERLRRADERAYRRARLELQRERDAAIEASDKGEVRRLDGEIEKLDDAERAPIRQTTQAAPKTDPVPPPPPPEVAQWGQENPWFYSDVELQTEAQAIHLGLAKTQPHLTVRQNLDEVTKRIKKMHPEKFAAPTPPKPAVDDDDDGADPPAAAVSTPGGPAGRARRNTRTFETMPKDAKDAYARYARMVDGKGKPLTKDEFATDYWAQFEEV